MTKVDPLPRREAFQSLPLGHGCAVAYLYKEPLWMTIVPKLISSAFMSVSSSTNLL